MKLKRYTKLIEEDGRQDPRLGDWGRPSTGLPECDKIHKAHYIMINVECSFAKALEEPD